MSILAVSKSVSAERLRAARAAGIEVFGENRVQEAEQKAELLPGARWQLIGRLQSNKAGRALALFEAIQSLDSLELARRLDRLAAQAGRKRYPVYVQVNVDLDPAKAGLLPEQLDAALPEMADMDTLELRGLMTVGRQVADAQETRPTFRALRLLAERLRAVEPRLGAGLSMGMSDDFEVAVEEGATVVRLGRVLFGERPAR